MILLLSAIDPRGEMRDFSCQLPQSTDGFDLLSTIQSRGCTLVKARVLEEHIWVQLPLEAFATNPTSPVIYQLEKEWQQVLNAPTDSSWLENEYPAIEPMAQTDHCIVYFSTSVGLFDKPDLDSILHQSRHNNAQANISGVLLYIHGQIIQVLEGEKRVLEALYKRIEQDRRNTNVTCVLNHSIQERLFARWSMGYETLTTRQLAEINTIIDLGEPVETLSKVKESTILKTLKGFYESNRYN